MLVVSMNSACLQTCDAVTVNWEQIAWDLVWYSPSRDTTSTSKASNSTGMPFLNDCVTIHCNHLLAHVHLQIINDAANIKAAYKEQPQHLDHLTSLIKDLYQASDSHFAHDS
jgi:hypothetical protein